MNQNKRMRLVFATNNAHKLEEIRQIIGGRWEILSLADIGCHEDIPETAPTLEGNALLKARYVKEKYGYDCFADDTGLMVDALDGAPGVYSARYAGPGHDSQANMRLLLERLEEKRSQGVTDRKAHFSTVIALIFDGRERLFEGRIDGEILSSPSGDGGFGYDPIFLPDGSELSFAEMSAEAKNAVSHRGRAIAALLDYLKS